MTDKLEDMLKERDRFVERIRKATLRASTTADKAATDDPRELRSRYLVRLEDLSRAKAEAIERYDIEIHHYSSLISDIERTLAAEDAGAGPKPVAEPQTGGAALRSRKAADRGGKRRDH